MQISVDVRLGPDEYASDLPFNATEIAERVLVAMEGNPRKDTVNVHILDGGLAGFVPAPPPEPVPVAD